MNKNQLLPEMSISLVSREHANIATRILIEREVWCQAKPLPGGDFIIIHETDKETEDVIDEACKAAKGTDSTTRYEFLCKACDQIWAGPEDGDCVGACPLCGSEDGQVRVEPSATTQPAYLAKALKEIKDHASGGLLDEDVLLGRLTAITEAADYALEKYYEAEGTDLPAPTQLTNLDESNYPYWERECKNALVILRDIGLTQYEGMLHDIGIILKDIISRSETERTNAPTRPTYLADALKKCQSHLRDASTVIRSTYRGDSATAEACDKVAEEAREALAKYEAEGTDSLAPQPAYLVEAMRPLLAIVSGRTSLGSTTEEAAFLGQISRDKVNSQVFVDAGREAIAKYEVEQKQIKQLPEIIISIEGGAAGPAIRNDAAKDVDVWVRDYDIPTNQPGEYKEDDNGREYFDFNL